MAPKGKAKTGSAASNSTLPDENSVLGRELHEKVLNSIKHQFGKLTDDILYVRFYKGTHLWTCVADEHWKHWGTENRAGTKCWNDCKLHYGIGGSNIPWVAAPAGSLVARELSEMLDKVVKRPTKKRVCPLMAVLRNRMTLNKAEVLELLKWISGLKPKSNENAAAAVISACAALGRLDVADDNKQNVAFAAGVMDEAYCQSFTRLCQVNSEIEDWLRQHHVGLSMFVQVEAVQCLRVHKGSLVNFADIIPEVMKWKVVQKMLPCVESNLASDMASDGIDECVRKTWQLGALSDDSLRKLRTEALESVHRKCASLACSRDALVTFLGLPIKVRVDAWSQWVEVCQFCAVKNRIYDQLKPLPWEFDYEVPVSGVPVDEDLVLRLNGCRSIFVQCPVLCSHSCWFGSFVVSVHYRFA